MYRCDLLHILCVTMPAVASSVAFRLWEAVTLLIWIEMCARYFSIYIFRRGRNLANLPWTASYSTRFISGESAIERREPQNSS